MMQDLQHLRAPLRAVVIVARLVGYVLFFVAVFALSVALGGCAAVVLDRLLGGPQTWL